MEIKVTQFGYYDNEKEEICIAKIMKKGVIDRDNNVINVEYFVDLINSTGIQRSLDRFESAEQAEYFLFTELVFPILGRV